MIPSINPILVQNQGLVDPVRALSEELDRWVGESGIGLAEEGARRIAAQKITDCYTRAAVSLDLRGCGLASLPTGCWRYFGQLRNLNLSRNRLSHLPGQISDLESLESLDLSENPLELAEELCNKLLRQMGIGLSLPSPSIALPAIGPIALFPRPPQLSEKLDIWVNQAEENPAEKRGRLVAKERILACCHSQTQYLDLNDLQLSSLPADCWTELGHVRNLNFSRNHLDSLPNQITALSQLRAINLDNNRFGRFPPQVFSFTDLRELYLRSNQIADIPSQIGDLSEIRALYLSANQIRTIPYRVTDLRNLESLELLENPLIPNPVFVGYLRARISGNGLSLPPAADFREILNPPEQAADTPSFIQELAKLKTSLQDRQAAGDLAPEPNSEQWRDLEGWDNSRELKTYLFHLRKSGNWNGNFPLQLNAYNLICDAAKNEEFREAVAESLDNATTSCGDRVAVFASEIEAIRKVVCEKMTRADAATYLLGMRKIGMIDKIVANYCVEKGWNDEVEASLAIQLELKERLNLPIQVSHALYFSPARDDVPLRERVFEEIEGKTNTPEKRAHELSQASLWIQFLEKSNKGKAFATAIKNAHQEMEAKLENENEGEMVRRVDEINRRLREQKAEAAREIALQVFQSLERKKPLKREGDPTDLPEASRRRIN